jgi:hypothetical protein
MQISRHRVYLKSARNLVPGALDYKQGAFIKYKKMVPFFAAIGALLFLVGAAQIVQASDHAPETGAIVRPEPLVFEIEAGEVETLTIVLENAVEVYGIDVRGQFDPNAVEVVDADLAKDGIQMVPGTIPATDFVFINSADNLTGSFQYVDIQINPTPPANGNGTVFSIRLLGKTTGDTAFTISSIKLSDRFGGSLQVTSQNGTIRVLPVGGLFSVYLPILQK